MFYFDEERIEPSVSVITSQKVLIYEEGLKTILLNCD